MPARSASHQGRRDGAAPVHSTSGGWNENRADKHTAKAEKKDQEKKDKKGEKKKVKGGKGKDGGGKHGRKG